jgi:hypothetical protein
LAPVVRENENAGHLDLLGSSALMLARTLIAAPAHERRRFVPSVRELADALTKLAKDPGDRPTRQAAADRALGVVRMPAGSAALAESTSSNAVLRIVAVDVMAFAGVDPSVAVAAVQQEVGDAFVPAPPAPPMGAVVVETPPAKGVSPGVSQFSVDSPPAAGGVPQVAARSG